jgi:hypothetical protein
MPPDLSPAARRHLAGIVQALLPSRWVRDRLGLDPDPWQDALLDAGPGEDLMLGAGHLSPGCRRYSTVGEIGRGRLILFAALAAAPGLSLFSRRQLA